MVSNPLFFLLLSTCALLTGTIFAQKKNGKNAKSEIRIQLPDTTSYARGIVVQDNFLYTSNSNGTVAMYNLDTQQSTVVGERLELEELRDIALVQNKVIALQSGTTGKMILLSNDSLVRTLAYDFWTDVFLDGMDFNGSVGFLMGDPIDNQFSLFLSLNSGKTWNRCEGKLEALEGEAGFAASGTTVQVLNDSTFAFVSGGSVSRFFRSNNRGLYWTSVELPFEKGEGKGAFSLCFINENEAVVLGGDYQQANHDVQNAFYTTDGGTTWHPASKNPAGYRSCVIYANNCLYACGTSGIDISKDKGHTWQHFTDGNYFSLASDGKFLYATAPKAIIKSFKLL